jgi:hypothetical protein
MKTKIRTQISDSNAMGSAYKHMYIQILTGRYGSKDDENLETMGSITFQANASEPNYWYGMRFVIETDRPDYIKRMAQLAKFIKDKRSDYSAQPKEILEIIGAEEFVHFDSIGFVPRASYGMGVFKVMTDKGGLYSYIIAENEAKASKQLVKKNIAGATLEFYKAVIF